MSDSSSVGPSDSDRDRDTSARMPNRNPYYQKRARDDGDDLEDGHEHQHKHRSKKRHRAAAATRVDIADNDDVGDRFFRRPVAAVPQPPAQPQPQDDDWSSCDELEEERAPPPAPARQQRLQFEQELEEQDRRARVALLRAKPKRRRHADSCFLHNYDMLPLEGENDGPDAFRQHIQTLWEMFRKEYARTGDIQQTARLMHCYYKAFVWREGGPLPIWRTYEIVDCIKSLPHPSRWVYESIRIYKRLCERIEEGNFEKMMYARDGTEIGLELDPKTIEAHLKVSKRIEELYKSKVHQMAFYDEQSALDLKPSNTFVNPLKFMTISKQRQ